MFEYSHGIHIVNTDLWLDARKIKDIGYISHAHADHIRRHKQVIATSATLKFYEKRVGKRSTFQPLDFHKSLSINDIEIELFPSGHILGASQIQVEKEGKRLIYTGDFNVYPAETTEPIEFRETDILIMEATFGLPHFRFPEKQRVIQQLTEFVDGCHAQNFIPVVMAYALGKGQEVIKILGDRGYHISVYKSIAAMTELYESCGVTFSNWQAFAGEDLHNRIMLVTPRMVNWIKGLYPNQVRTAMVTGWAIDKKARYRYKSADVLIPLSDHADFEGLLEYVRQTSPQKIYVTHGYYEFVDELNRQGYKAEPLEFKPQLTLF